MSDSITARLAAAGITLPPAPAPVAAYVGYVVHNNIVTVSGQLPFVDGKLTTTGLLGDTCLLYTSPSPRDLSTSRMPSSA